MRTRSRWITLSMFIAGAIALLAFSACGGDDNSSNTPAASNTGGATNTGGAGGSSTSGATKTSQATEQPTASTDILDELSSLGNDIQAITGKVTYNSTDPDGTTSTITFYSKPPKSRFDTVDSDGSSTAYIETPDATYICSSSENACIKSPGSSSDTGLGLFGALFSPQYVDALVSAARAEGIDVQKSSENIAGNDATCFSGTETDGSTGKFCFSDSGVLLSEESTDSTGTQKLEATAFSNDVPDSDFDPPYTVTELPTG